MKRVCALDEMTDGGGLDAEIGNGLPIAVFREGDSVHAYVNVCPHQARMLNFAPDRFMVRNGVVTCSHHGATFRVSDGACLGGPCRGAPLRRLRAVVHDGEVFIGEENDNAD